MKSLYIHPTKFIFLVKEGVCLRMFPNFHFSNSSVSLCSSANNFYMGKKLPLGLQDFRKIIENDFKYIDKTEYIYRMVSKPGAYFLSRPRRFGKSITVAVLQELYSGSKELFRGLWIEDKWDWSRKHPVIRLSFTGIGFAESGLPKAMHYQLDKLIREHGLPPANEANLSAKFEYLIQELGKVNRVVVLIDEYDAPIIHFLGKDVVKAHENRETLREFYSVLKNNDPALEFVFLTGVSKFSKVGIFSGLNNLTDLTMQSDFATMLGYTQAELESNFAEEIEAVSIQLKMTRTELLDKMRLWYNGYRFHVNSETVYNPVSTNLFFNQKEFDNFWFATGTPTFLINLLKQEGLYDIEHQEHAQLDFDSFDLEDLRAYGLLYQTGYLTIKSRNEFGLYILDYPNHEVKNSMYAYLLEAFGGVRKGQGLVVAVQLERAFYANDLEQVIRILQAMFKGLPHLLHEKYPEKFFHAAIHLLFKYMGLRVQSEVMMSDARADCVVETDVHVYILEFKLDKSAQVALEQIKLKKYHQAYWEKGKKMIGVGVNFSSETKNIEDWVEEELG